MVKPKIFSKVRNGVCAVGYLTIDPQQFNEAIKDPKRRPDEFFKVVGTGFLVRETSILTNRHVIKGLGEIQKKDGVTGDRVVLQFTYPVSTGVEQIYCPCHGFTYPAEISQDVGLLDFTHPPDAEFEQCQPLKFINTHQQIKIGQAIGVLGFPLGSELLVDVQIVNGPKIQRFGPMLQQGYVSALAPFDKSSSVSDVLLDVRSAPGMSGSPVFDPQTGQVIGIFYAGDGILTAFAKPLTRKRINELLDAHDQMQAQVQAARNKVANK